MFQGGDGVGSRDERAARKVEPDLCCFSNAFSRNLKVQQHLTDGANTGGSVLKDAAGPYQPRLIVQEGGEVSAGHLEDSRYLGYDLLMQLRGVVNVNSILLAN